MIEVMGQHNRGRPHGDEQARLRASFGALLRAERVAAAWTISQLADRIDAAPSTISRLEVGQRRPSTGLTWRLSKALRPGAGMYERVRLDVRLRAAAGPSLRDFSYRAHRRRERMAAEILADEGPELIPVAPGEDFAAYVSAILATRVPDVDS